MNKEVINMRIEGTHLGLDDRNRFTFTLSLSDDDGSGCGFGGWSLGRAGSDMLGQYSKLSALIHGKHCQENT